jgi:hypothetical protein
VRLIDKKPVLYVSTHSETIDLLREFFDKKSIEFVVTDDMDCANAHLIGRKNYYTALIIEACTISNKNLSGEGKIAKWLAFAEKHQLNGERVIVLYDNISQCTFITRFASFSRCNLSEIKDYLIAMILGLPQIDSK